MEAQEIHTTQHESLPPEFTNMTLAEFLEEVQITVLTRNDTLSGEEIVKGFSCQVAKLFE